jgi:Flp pilus assembly protein TadG
MLLRFRPRCLRETTADRLRSPLCRRLLRVTKDTEGSALLQTTIVLPVLLFFVLTVMELSLLYNARQMANYAAFCAARTASTYGIDSTAKTHLAAAVAMSSIASAAAGNAEQVLQAYGLADPSRAAAALCSIPGFQSNDAKWQARLANAYVRTYQPQCDTGTATGKTRKHVVANVTYVYRCSFLPFGEVWGEAGVAEYCNMLAAFPFYQPYTYGVVAPLADLIRNNWRWNITIHGRAVTDYWAG